MTERASHRALFAAADPGRKLGVAWYPERLGDHRSYRVDRFRARQSLRRVLAALCRRADFNGTVDRRPTFHCHAADRKRCDVRPFGRAAKGRPTSIAAPVCRKNVQQENDGRLAEPAQESSWLSLPWNVRSLRPHKVLAAAHHTLALGFQMPPMCGVCLAHLQQSRYGFGVSRPGRACV